MTENSTLDKETRERINNSLMDQATMELLSGWGEEAQQKREEPVNAVRFRKERDGGNGEDEATKAKAAEEAGQGKSDAAGTCRGA
jgi:hypothetical protein